MKAKDKYEIKKNALLASVKEFQITSEKFALNKTTSNLFRPKTTSSRDKVLNVKHFNEVIHLDEEKKLVEVEGMTSYENLVQKTLERGHLPPVVPELKSITVGGAYCGCGIESSSFRYGLVHETIQNADVFLSNGQVVTCSPNNHYRDLFFAFPNSFGTLGYALKIILPLVSVGKYVKLHHIRFADAEAFFENMQEFCKEYREEGGLTSFIDGVIFNSNEMYITVATSIDRAPWISNYRYKNIYYQSIREKKEDYLPISDYIWRWDADWFWCSRVFFMQNLFIRLLLGKFMLHSSRYAKIMHWFERHPFMRRMVNFFHGQKESIIQDIAIPIDQALKFYTFVVEKIGITPIWICPTQSFHKKAMFDFCPIDPDKLYVDFGIWDSINTKKQDGYYTRQIEKIAIGLNGFKSLYSRSFYTEDEFWTIYDYPKYIQVKNKYDPENRLRGLYEKCTNRL